MVVLAASEIAAAAVAAPVAACRLQVTPGAMQTAVSQATGGLLHGLSLVVPRR